MGVKKFGYVRVSSIGQNTERQEVLMRNLGVDVVYIERVSGKNVTERPQLNAMLDSLRPGDTVVVESISRFARNTMDLLDLIDTLNKKNVIFISQKENIDTTTSTGMFMLTIFGAVASLEREYIRERQLEGIKLAKEKGKYKGRKKIERKNFDTVYKRWKSKAITAVEAMKLLDMKPNTFYRRVKEYENNSKDV